MHPNRKKRNRRLPPGPTLHRERPYEHKPPPIHHLIKYRVQPRRERLQLHILNRDLRQLDLRLPQLIKLHKPLPSYSAKR